MEPKKKLPKWAKITLYTIGGFMTFVVLVGIFAPETPEMIAEQKRQDSIEAAEIAIANKRAADSIARLKIEDSYTIISNVEEVENRFNNYFKEIGLDMRVTNLEAEDGAVQNTFKYQLNDNVMIMGTLNKRTNGVKELFIMGSGDGSYQSGANILLTMLGVIAVVQPDLEPQQRAEILKNIGFIGELDNFTEGKTVINGIRYWGNKNEISGVMFGAINANNS